MVFEKGNKGYWLGKKRPNLWNGTRLDLKGKHLSPNTEFKKGEHIHPETEYKKGHNESKEILLKRTNTMKKLYKEGKIKVWSKGLTPRQERYRQPQVKINGRFYPKSHLVWIKANNIHRVPDGCIIHHLDFNPKNNTPENLQLLPIDYHRNFHIQMQKQMLLNQIR